MSAAPPVRVLRAITRLNIGGPAIHTILLTEALNDGVAFESKLVTGVTAAHEGDMLDLARSKGVVPLVIPELGREISAADDLRALVKMVRLVRRLRPDVVHTHMAKAGTVGRIAAHLARVPLVVHTYHGHVFHGYFSPRKTWVFLKIEQALAKVTDTIVVVGERQRDEIAAFKVAPRTKLLPIPLGLELERFLDSERYRGELRRELGLEPTAPVVGIVARLVPIKAHEDFLAAARIVAAVLPAARFLVVGDGELRAELEATVARMGLGELVRFVGWRADLPRIYADLDVVALSSHNEGSPVALIEALAAGRPVVATDVGGVAEVVLDGRTGRTVPARAPDRLASAILDLLQDRSAAESLGAAGRRHVYPRYASARLVEDMGGLYRHALSARGRLVPAGRGSPSPETSPTMTSPGARA